MNNFIKKIPLPVAGVMLSLAALGNLVGSYNTIFKNFLGLLSALILISLTAKIFIFNKSVRDDLKNPVVASVIPTYSMGIMLLSVYLKPLSFNIALLAWILGFLIHIILMIFYSVKFLYGFNIRKLFPSTFVVYVGIGVAGITAPAFKLNNLGQAVFWFAFISFTILLPILIYRSFIIKEIPEPALPTLAIFAAPASLCLTAYLNSFKDKSIYIVGFLAVLSLILYTAVLLLSLPKLFKLKFYPSFAAFTFPMVISAIAMKTTNVFLISSSIKLGFLKPIVSLQEGISIFVVFYVLTKYLIFMFEDSTVQINKSVSK